MKHSLKYRELVGETRYTEVIKDLQNRIKEMSGLAPGAMPVINDALWDNNPRIVFGDDRKTGQIYFTSLTGFFSKLEDYLKTAINRNTEVS